MPRSVVCGVDSSPGARAAATVAFELARHLALKLVLVHVGHVTVVAGAATVPHGIEDLRELAEDDARAVLAEIAEDLGDEGERRVEVGAAADVLRRVALEEAAALLVVGCRGRGQLRAALVGSVSGALCRSAPCPVVVVPPTGAAAALSSRETTAAAA